jgi:hypothetical protein
MECNHCHGTGEDEWDEDGRIIYDCCIKCQGSGSITEDEAEQAALQQSFHEAAFQIIRKLIKAYNEDPDGDGWNMCAAECMMSERDYTQARIWEKEAEIANAYYNDPKRYQEIMEQI